VDEKKPNQNAQFSLKRNGMESVLGFNNPIENLLDALHRRLRF
jgi:argininosuccinate lyase